jgi:hypothetical protein
MCDGMDLNIVTRDDRVVLPRVEVVLEDSDDENDGEDDMTPEEVAAAKAKFEALVKGTDGDEDDAEWVDEDEDDDAPPPPPRLESEIEAEHAPALYGSTKVVDIEDLAFPASLLGVGALLENVETLRIKAVPSSGFLGDWPVSFKNVTVWHNEMNYEYGPFMDEDDSDLDSDEEDEEDEEKAEDKTEGSAEKEKVKVSADADADDENDVSYVPDEDDSDDEEETILCTSRFVLNITPSHATTPKVTKALEDLINYLNAPLDEITIVFNVDKAYKREYRTCRTLLTPQSPRTTSPETTLRSLLSLRSS